MEIKTSYSGDIILIRLIGRLDTGTSPAAETVINKELESGKNKLIINLAETEYLSSSGLRVLLVTAKKISAIKGKMKICEPNDVVREILDISGFSTILDVRESQEEAMGEFIL
jgi:anti-anti-sigma factor